jgi:hypothetical protein
MATGIGEQDVRCLTSNLKGAPTQEEEKNVNGFIHLTRSRTGGLSAVRIISSEFADAHSMLPGDILLESVQEPQAANMR